MGRLINSIYLAVTVLKFGDIGGLGKEPNKANKFIINLSVTRGKVIQIMSEQGINVMVSVYHSNLMQ